MKAKVIFQCNKIEHIDEYGCELDLNKTSYVLDKNDSCIHVDCSEDFDFKYQQKEYVYYFYQFNTIIRSLSKINIEEFVDKLDNADPSVYQNENIPIENIF